MFSFVLRKILIDEVVDAVLFFNLLMSIVGYYVDPTVREEELRYTRDVLAYRPGRGRLPDWIRLHIEACDTPAE